MSDRRIAAGGLFVVVLIAVGVWLGPKEGAGSMYDEGMGGGLILLAIALLIYFIPTMVARSREHRQSGAIFVLNLFLGWTLIGWVVALVWGCTTSQPVAPLAASAPRASTVSELERLAALHASGAIDADEFAALKAKVLAG